MTDWSVVGLFETYFSCINGLRLDMVSDDAWMDGWREGALVLIA